MAIELKSNAFEHEGFIPEKYSCDGDDISPQIEWSGFPDNTESFTIIVEDPDAPGGTFDHWFIYNIPGDVTSLNENVTTTANLPPEAIQGTNSFGNIGYGGPCPPSDTHRYYFKIYALDTFLQLKTGANKKEIHREMDGHILDKGELMGKYTHKG